MNTFKLSLISLLTQRVSNIGSGSNFTYKNKTGIDIPTDVDKDSFLSYISL